MELIAELTTKDGSVRPFQVKCERTLTGLCKGLEQLKGEVSCVITELVVKEKGATSLTAGDIESAGEEDEDEEEEDEESSKNEYCGNGPPNKRSKMCKDKTD
ncbi:hypothetical protein GDO86_015962 [Hymenochirus boettgeri]|uniref:Uncharacterized protein n=1 Tax=Hymenochirus boettgeri TaxID=247094 RepID=A0A8T2JV37_9PIPI|nr:hypothetical protein GDO86_015962 [Hymenochirus boettgeri]